MGTTKKQRTKSKSGGEVIHVAFGRGGGRISHAVSEEGHPAQLVGHAPPPSAEAPTTAEPVTQVFTPAEVSKLLGLTLGRLRTLDKCQLVSPSGMRKGRRAYTFQDLIALRATQGLLRERIRLKDVAEAIGALRRALPRVTRPLQELRIASDGRRVIVHADGATFEPVTGQMVLDFRVDALRDDVVRVLRHDFGDVRGQSAYDCYVRASSIDEDPDKFEEAERLYRKATELDPNLAIAYTNLGNIRFRRGDETGAEALYRKAIELDDRQPEAHYNLGYVMFERGYCSRAITYFETAIKYDPRFADAHFNLAMASEAMGDKTRARVHWKTYLELEPSGTWADIARSHL